MTRGIRTADCFKVKTGEGPDHFREALLSEYLLVQTSETKNFEPCKVPESENVGRKPDSRCKPGHFGRTRVTSNI